MSAIQPPTPNHQGETLGSGETQFFECEALSADHPEIQARERARQQLCSSPIQPRSRACPHLKGKRAVIPNEISNHFAAVDLTGSSACPAMTAPKRPGRTSPGSRCLA
jgi:hypothetical protein